MSRLRFHDCLGRGGYGAVYRATWFTSRGMELEVAVKVLNAAVARGSDAQRRLRDEARLLGALTHPGIVRAYDLIEVRGAVGMIAEYIEGQDLDRCVLDGLTPRALVEVVSKVSCALAAAWGDLSPVSGKPLRLVHRDIKPENLRVTPTGLVKILDFGVARAAEFRRESETASNMVLGSYRYMAPERFDSGLEPHPSLDVFALGAILYEGLAYRRLFEHLSVREMLVLSLPGTDRYEHYIDARIAELPPQTDTNLIELIRRLVSRDPAVRPMPGRLAAICDDLADSLAGLELGPWCRSRTWEYLSAGDAELTGVEIELSKGTSAAIGVPSADGHTAELKATETTLDGVAAWSGTSHRSDDPDLQETVRVAAFPTPSPAPPKRRAPTPPPPPPRRSSEPSWAVRDRPEPEAVTEGLLPLKPRELVEPEPRAWKEPRLPARVEPERAEPELEEPELEEPELEEPELEEQDPWEPDPDETATQVISAQVIQARLAISSSALPDDAPTSEGLPIVPEQEESVYPALTPDGPTQPDGIEPAPSMPGETNPSMPKLYAAEHIPELPQQDEDETVEVVAPFRQTGNPALMSSIIANLTVLVMVIFAGVVLVIAWVVLA